MVAGDCVAPVHKVVGHYVGEVEGLEDGGHVGCSEGYHVPLEPWDGGREEFSGAQGGANIGQEEGIGGDFGDFG